MKLFKQKWIFGIVLFFSFGISSAYASTYSFSACSPECYTHIFTLDTNKSIYNQNENMTTSLVYDGATCYSLTGCYIGAIFYVDVRNNLNNQTEAILPRTNYFRPAGESKTSVFNVGSTPAVSGVTFVITVWYGNFGTGVQDPPPQRLSWNSSLAPPTPGYTVGWFFSDLATIPYTVTAPPAPTVNLNFSFIEIFIKDFFANVTGSLVIPPWQKTLAFN